MKYLIMFVDFSLKMGFLKERNQVQFELQLHQPSEIPPTSLAETRASTELRLHQPSKIPPTALAETRAATANKMPGHHPPSVESEQLQSRQQVLQPEGLGVRPDFLNVSTITTSGCVKFFSTGVIFPPKHTVFRCKFTFSRNSCNLFGSAF